MFIKNLQTPASFIGITNLYFIVFFQNAEDFPINPHANHDPFKTNQAI
jgi:hypothetical protein